MQQSYFCGIGIVVGLKYQDILDFFKKKTFLPVAFTPGHKHDLVSTFVVCLQAIASRLPIILIKGYDTGRWAHINVKLLHWGLTQDLNYPLIPINPKYPHEGLM